MSKQNLIMVDFAKQDTRSVAAMLRGVGDGREVELNEFITREALKDPLVSHEQLNKDFALQARAEFNRNIHQIRKDVGSTWLRNKAKRSILSLFKFAL